MSFCSRYPLLMGKLCVLFLTSYVHTSSGIRKFPYLIGGYSYDFKTCNALGKDGPSQQQCNFMYIGTNVTVKVIEKGRFKGVQVWTVPETETYTIHATGAGGGEGVKTQGSRGAQIEAIFTLEKGEKIYILVGQKGTKACSSSMTSPAVKEICRQGHTSNGDMNATIVGGGGGGGGASFVFKMDPVTQEPILLLVAGGGGGLAYENPNSKYQTNTVMLHEGTGSNGHTNPSGAGGGGGFNASTSLPQAGKALLSGAQGGKTCEEASKKLKWMADGGFGGGGGGCTSGGGGGGFIGGNASAEDKLFFNGQGGTSYYHPSALEPNTANGEYGDGYVEINSWYSDCQCKQICNVDNWKLKTYHCSCFHGWKLAADGHSCHTFDSPNISRFDNRSSNNDTLAQELSVRLGVIDLGYIVVIGVICAIVVVCVSVFCLVKRYQQKKHLNAVRLELITASQSFTIRPTPLNENVTDRAISNPRRMTEYNPTYDFSDLKQSDQQLRELNRNNLKLVRALGQGAFGEVYKGYLSGIPRSESQPVAVKTLSAFSTQESELDFLMEAVIMSKFHHPNIVKFIGVCFESHPRYIVLELLDGGDLKTFLREMRPKPDMSPPLVTVSDLLSLAIDIAKGCQHLEERHFIHRDIAARNCLLTCKGVNRHVKIADFGMARDVYRSDYYKKGGKAMLPIKWMPPEAFLDGVFTSKTDVWSFGILLWEIFSMGYMPYPGRTNHDVMQFVTGGGRLEAPDKCPHSIVQLMSICCAAIPETRPTFAEISEYLHRSSQNEDILNGELPTFVMIPSFGNNKSDVPTTDSIPTSITIETTLNDPSSDLEDEINMCSRELESNEPLLTPTQTQDRNTHCGQNDVCKNSKNSPLFVHIPDEKSSNEKHLPSTNNSCQPTSIDTMVQTNIRQDLSHDRKSKSRIGKKDRIHANENYPLLVSHSPEGDDKADLSKESRDSVSAWKTLMTKPTRSSLYENQKSSPHLTVKKMKSANI